MVYVGVAPRVGYGEPDNAFIDPSLPVSGDPGDPSESGMSYWPNYTRISPRNRATYLYWLTSGRDGGADPGYMFLYFYGLERRFFVDDPDEAERKILQNEVARLHALYSDNRSANRYLGAFLDAAALVLGDENSGTEVGMGEIPLGLKVALARRVAAGEPLTAALLRAWYIADPEARLRTPARRCEPEFAALFDHLFERDHPGGLVVRPPKRKLTATYHSASGRFEADLGKALGELPDVTTLRKPLAIAAEIAEEATAALDGLSRLLGKDAEARGTMAAHALLPVEIRDRFPSPEADALKAWAAERIAGGGLVDALDLIERLTGERPEKLTRKRLTDASTTLLGLGVAMAPDPRFALRAPKGGEPVVLFELPPDIHELDVSDTFRAATLRIAVATMIAQADETVEAAEEEAISAMIHGTPDLSIPERLRLSATARWMRAVPPDMAMLRKRLKDAPPKARQMFAALAVDMAAADGDASKDEIAHLEKLYKALDLDPAALYGDIHAAIAGRSDEPATVRAADPGPGGVPIPPEVPAHGLDTAKIESITADTRDVAALLGGIFAGDEPDEEPEPEDATGEDTLPGLAAPLTAFARELAAKEHWSEADVEALAERHGLMPAGAVEALNEWSFEAYDRAYLDDYDGYDIDPEIAADIGG